jgi:V/A-type H+-transporting ATPase subunit K
MNWRTWVVALALVAFMGMASAAMASEAGKAEGAAATGPTDIGSTYKLVGKAFAAALAAGISIAGAGYAVARVGSAAVGAVAEKPELMGRTILFVALAEGLAVLGFAIAILIMYTMV